MTIVGTRPELIRLSRVITRLDAAVDHVLVHTGQNYDYTLNEIFFKDLRIRPPDHSLGVNTSSLGLFLGETLIRAEEVLLAERPDAVLILGDTNSSVAAIMAKRMKIPVYHMEAGNRCFDENVPEETNRRLIDHVADFNLVYTEHARRNLLAEGVHPRRILLTGSPMGEVLSHYRQDFERSQIIQQLDLTEKQYFLVSAHREENVDLRSRLGQLVHCLATLQEEFGIPIIVSTHPRTRSRLASFPRPNGLEAVRFHEPFGFHDYNRLQLSAVCVLSDSGTIAEESSILGFPAVTLRDSIERPEALDAGRIIMTGLDPDDVVAAVTIAVEAARRQPAECLPAPENYDVNNCSDRVLGFLISTCRRHRAWAGLRPPEEPPVVASK